MARNRMIEVTYTMETGAVVTDYMQSKNPKKTMDKAISRVYSQDFLHSGPISLETAGIVSVNFKVMEIN